VPKGVAGGRRGRVARRVFEREVRPHCGEGAVRDNTGTTSKVGWRVRGRAVWDARLEVVSVWVPGLWRGLWEGPRGRPSGHDG
jgi:hypothetical protein